MEGPTRRVKTPRQNQEAQKGRAYGLGMSITGYVRVSTDDQDEASQVAALEEAGCSVLYVERASGATTCRPEWKACLRSLGRGDTLVVVRIDRLGRSLVELVQIIDELHARGIEFRSLTEAIDTTTPAGRMVFQVAGAFAEYERALIRARTREGLAAARARGAHIGRPRVLSPEQAAHARALRAQGQSVSTIARILSCSASTIRRLS